MRSVEGEAAIATSRRDPAPSRLAYRVQRLWLTPFYRAMFRVGLPVFFILLGVGWYVSDVKNRTYFVDQYDALKREVIERPEFLVKLVAIEGASREVDAAIREILPVKFPVSTFDLDLEQLRHEVLRLDIVKSAELRLRPGGVLDVQVVERMPVVVWGHDGVLDMLDQDGMRVASLRHRLVRQDLPLLIGDGAELAVGEALELAKVAAPIWSRVTGLVRVGSRRWNLELADGKQVMLPEDKPISALEQVVALDQAQELLSRDISHVDMRFAERPTLRLGGVAKTMLVKIKNSTMGDIAQ